MRTIYRNGAVYTGELPLCRAFVVEDGRFICAGSDEDALAMKEPGDEVKDLKEDLCARALMIPTCTF